MAQPAKISSPDDLLLRAERELQEINSLLQGRSGGLGQDAAALSLLLEVSRKISRVLNQDQLLDTIMDSVMELTGASRGFLMLYDQDGKLNITVTRAGPNQAWDKDDLRFSRTITEKVITTGQPLWLKDISQDPEFNQAASVADLQLRSAMCVPLFAGQAQHRKAIGVIYVDSRQIQETFSHHDLDLLVSLAAQAAISIENARLVEGIKTLEEEKRLRLERENLSLQQLLDGRSDLLGQCPAMDAVFSIIRRVAGSEVNLLLLGESGTGKTLVARDIHELSPRREKPFTVIDCGSIPENLLESELFGYEKGAFTGAFARKLGKFELANGGTIFLDEIGEMALPLQIKLLRAIQEGIIEHLGGREQIRVDVRIIAATNHDLEQDVAKGMFRKDLYYRLNIITLELPPLRDRDSDILLLAESSLKKFSLKHKKEPARFSPEAKSSLMGYPWPGNVRELEHKIERAVIMCDDRLIEPDHLGLLPSPRGDAESGNLKEAKRKLERQRLSQALAACRWDITASARQLGITRQQVYRLIGRYKIKPPGGKEQ
jgi:transcriptional regulator with GAF, ATPase, and Fis domain